MRLFAVTLALLMIPTIVMPGAAIAAEAEAGEPDVAATIDRGVAFLVKDALAWKSEHNCVSCHHAGLVVWAMREARQRGRGVDEPVLAELTQWIAQSGDGKTGVPRPEGIPKAFNEKAVSLALALGADRNLEDKARRGLSRMLQTVKDDQLDNGAWASWPDTRPPMFGNSDQRATAAGALALLPAIDADDAAKAASQRAVEWLASKPSDNDPQSEALRVVLWKRLGRSMEEVAPYVARIRERQNSDGGWSQTPEMASDAWGTGQALYALAHAGVEPSDPSIRGGQKFLARTQREDGSWPMISRPIKPGGAGSTSLIPITGAGSAWAVIGLARSY